MKKKTALLQTVTLIVLSGLILAGCNSGSGEVRYVNKTNPSETLTLNRSKNVKTKLIYTFHGVSTGSYTLKTDKGTFSAPFSSDGDAIKFSWQEGKSEKVKIKTDGSFDFANATWAPVPQVIQKSLKAVASSKEGAGK